MKLKVTSEDCVKFIVEGIVPELANSKNWVRTGKKKVDDAIIRVFKNKKTGLEIEIMEKDGVIKRDLVIFNHQWLKLENPEDNWEEGKILFCLTKSNQYADVGLPNIFQMYVVGKKYYDKNKCLNDCMHTGPICDLLQQNGFNSCEFIESGIEFYQDTNIEALKKYLGESKVFTTNKAFEEFMTDCNDSGYEIVSLSKE
jgi:hypothetical protein